MTTDRIPPQNIEAEQCVVGALLIDPYAIPAVADILKPEDFYRRSNQLIYEAILAVNERGEGVDLVTVVEELQSKGKLEEIGGSATVTALSNVVPTAANAVYHAHIVEDKSLRRQLIRTATEIAANGYEEEQELNGLLDAAEQRILKVSRLKSTEDFAKIEEVTQEALERIEKAFNSKQAMTGIPTGFGDFDRLTSGLQPSDLIILAARPSMGKSTLALNIAQNVALRQGKSIAYFSLEMSKEQLVQRMLCSEARINAMGLRQGQLKDGEMFKILQVCDKISEAKIFLDDTTDITGMEMRAKCRRLQRHNGPGLDLVIVDYLQLMQSSSKKYSENRQQELSEISRSLKALAREMNVPVIALSQLSRAVEQRPVKRPMLSDLRESGALEQDADIVAFLYRESYYKEDCEFPDLTELILAKHRNGPTGTVKLTFRSEFTRFDNYLRE